MDTTCSKCSKSPPQVTLKRCAKCSTTPYCSRECQKADWKSHKTTCGKQNSSGTTGSGSGAGQAPSTGGGHSPPKGLDQAISKPFTRLDNGTWLHDRPETDVYRLLIDAYRLRAEDNHTFDGDTDGNGVYGGAPDGLSAFQAFLKTTASRPRLLPPWWNAEKQAACEKLGMDASQWNDLHRVIKKSDIIEHYGDAQFPMQLRMFGETVLKRGPGGSNGSAMRKAMMAMEQGTAEAGVRANIIDNKTLNVSEVRR